MKVILRKILDTVSPTNNSAGGSAWHRLFEQPLPAPEAFRLRRLATQIDAVTKPFYETRTELIKKFGTLVEDDKYEFKGTAANDFNDEIEQLLSVEVTIDAEPIKLNRISEVKISAADLNTLDWLIVE